jgi:predicted Zn-dependent protease
MDFDKIKAIVEKAEGLAGWQLRRAETDATTTIRMPGVYTAREGSFLRQPNPHPREVILSPSEEVWVTLYGTHRADGNEYLGEAVGQITSDDEAAVREVLATLARAAAGQRNQPWPLGDAAALFPQVELADHELQELSHAALLARVQRFADAVLNAARGEFAIEVSNLEVFVKRLRTRIATSSGVALEYQSTDTNAEICFIARFGDKVAEHTSRPHARRLRDLDPQALVLMGAVHARGIAQAGPPPRHSGPVVLTGTAAHDFLKLGHQPLAWHSGARAIHEKTSRYQKGQPAWGDKPLAGDPLTIYSDPLIPFGPQSAIEAYAEPARRTCLLKDGCWDDILGPRRYYHYLGLLEQGARPSGPAGNTVIPPGPHRTAELLAPDPSISSPRTILVRSFSDFQTDPASGDFAAEIRLGETRQDGTETPFKGGLLIGNWFHAIGDIKLSTETIADDGYYGPATIRIGHLQIAG